MRKLALISAIALAAAVSGCSKSEPSAPASSEAAASESASSTDPEGCQPNCGPTNSVAPTEVTTEAAK